MSADIEKYLNEEMDEETKRHFDTALANDPALQAEVAEARYFLERLRGQMLREKVAAALKEEETPPPPGFKLRGWRLIGLSLAFALLFFTVLYFFQRPPSATPPEHPAPGTPEMPFHQQKSAPAPERSQTPVAEKQPPEKTSQLPAEPEGLRGNDDPANEAWLNLVNSVWELRFEWQPADFPARFAPVAAFIKEKDFTQAYVELQTIERESPQNDTLLFLKAHCLTDMRAGKEALRYLDRLSGTEHPWQKETEWLEGLCYLLIGEKQRSRAVFKTIAATPGHPYRTEAQAALRKIR
jgi:hypothetical protein